MPTVVNLRKMLHRKSAEYCNPCPAGNTTSGGFIVSDKSNLIPGHDIAYYVGSASTIWNYNSDEDAWVQIAASGIAGTFGAGSCGEFRAVSAPGGITTLSATSGSTTTTINTSLSLVRSAKDYEIRVVAGAGMGYSGKVVSNTLGTNCSITVTPASSVSFDNTTRFQITGGSLWFWNAGAGAVGFSVYDRLTNTWTARSVSGMPTTWGTDAQLVSTPGRSSNKGRGFLNGTSTGGNTTTTLNTGRTMLADQWRNYQVRIISGTGAGQVRGISANAVNGVITVESAWTVTPDATSVYRVEGNDDYFYLLGNAASTIYRFSISTNTWTTLTPTTARAGTPGGGMTAGWVDAVLDSDWQDESTTSTHHSAGLVRQNGRYIYSFRGGSTASLDVYDIAANTWLGAVSYGQSAEGFGGGTCSVDLDGMIYIQRDSTGRILRFDVAKNVMEPWTLNPVPNGTAVAGDKMFMTTYNDGGTEIQFLYTMGHSRAELTRWLVV